MCNVRRPPVAMHNRVVAPYVAVQMCSFSQACGIRLKRLQDASAKNAAQRKKKPGFSQLTTVIRKKKDNILPPIESLRLPPSTSDHSPLPFISLSASSQSDFTSMSTPPVCCRVRALLAVLTSSIAALSKLQPRVDTNPPSQGDSMLFLNFISMAAGRVDSTMPPPSLNA